MHKIEGSMFEYQDLSIFDTRTNYSMTENVLKHMIRQIHSNGKFEYGYDVETLLELPDSQYNSLRHVGAIWAICRALSESVLELNYIEYDNILNDLYTAIKYMENNLSMMYPDRTESKYICSLHKNILKSGGNGLALLAITEFYDLIVKIKLYDKYDIWYERMRHLQDLAVCYHNGLNYFIKDNKILHSLNSLTFKEISRCTFYNGEVMLGMLSMISKREAIIAEKYLGTINKVKGMLKALYEKREEYGHKRDHWVMQTIELLMEISPIEKWMWEYALKIFYKTQMVIGHSYKSGPNGCKLETATSFANILTIVRGMYISEQSFDVLSRLNNRVINRTHFIISHSYPLSSKEKHKTVHREPFSSEVRIDDSQHVLCGLLKLKSLKESEKRLEYRLDIYPESKCNNMFCLNYHNKASKACIYCNSTETLPTEIIEIIDGMK